MKISPITISTFPNPEGLNSLGSNLYTQTDASGTAIDGQTPGVNGIGTLQQGYVEGSNVSVVTEIVNLITAQRAFEANSKAVTTADQVLATAVNTKAQ